MDIFPPVSLLLVAHFLCFLRLPFVPFASSKERKKALPQYQSFAAEPFLFISLFLFIFLLEIAFRQLQKCLPSAALPDRLRAIFPIKIVMLLHCVHF